MLMLSNLIHNHRTLKINKEDKEMIKEIQGKMFLMKTIMILGEMVIEMTLKEMILIEEILK